MAGVDASYTVAVLPMRPLGAPMGVLVLRDLDPSASIRALRDRIQRHVQQVDPANSRVVLHRADLRLEMFAGHASWRFVSTLPLGQLLARVEVAPFRCSVDTPLRGCLATAPEIMSTPSQDPPRVVHLIAEIVDGVNGSMKRANRFGDHRRLFDDEDPEALAQLYTFLSTPPEPFARPTRSASTTQFSTAAPFQYPRAPCYLTNVPAIAQLTLPENKMLVRPVFAKLLDEILRDLPHTKRTVFVAATSGAGKTAFLWCVLHALCRRGRTFDGTKCAPPMDIVLDVPGLFVLIDTAGHVWTGSRRDQCFGIELMKKETLHLVDLAHSDHQELQIETDIPNNRHASRVLVGLPRHRVESRTLGLRGCVVKLIPPWNDGELELCRRVCFPALNRSLLIARIKFWGRQPLWTLAMAPAEGIGEHRFVCMVGDLDWLARISDTVVRNAIKDDHSPSLLVCDAATELLVLQPPGHKPIGGTTYRPQKVWRVRWSSSVVREAVLQRVYSVQNGAEAPRLMQRYESSLGLARLVVWDLSDADETYLDYGGDMYWERM